MFYLAGAGKTSSSFDEAYRLIYEKCPILHSKYRQYFAKSGGDAADTTILKPAFVRLPRCLEITTCFQHPRKYRPLQILAGDAHPLRITPRNFMSHGAYRPRAGTDIRADHWPTRLLLLWSQRPNLYPPYLHRSDNADDHSSLLHWSRRAVDPLA